MEMKHFSHDHPLLGLVCTPKQDEGTIVCAGCRSHINGPAFGCKKCGFFLHKRCVELPPELRHSLHPDGPLKLKLCTPYSRMRGLYMCKICLDYITEPRFVYECNGQCSSDECKRKGFIIHDDCASLQPSLRNNYHIGHLLVECKGFGYRQTCAACGAEFDLCHDGHSAFHAARGARFPLDDESRDLIYRCLECENKIFHKECLDKLAPVKRVRRHQHDLNLHLEPIPEDYEEKDYYCDECEEKRNVQAFSYACIECEFICHIRCDLFKNIEENRQKRSERETREEVREYQKHLDEIEEKIEPLEKELRELLCDKSRCEESIKKLQEKLRSRLKRKREEIS
ncbi:hypothetical protein Ancab_021740 [Ancistrocladus abbreviatus]